MRFGNFLRGRGEGWEEEGHGVLLGDIGFLFHMVAPGWVSVRMLVSASM